MDFLAMLTILFGSLSLLCLLILHFASPEFHPGWRMVSEYALGKHKWLLTLFFFFWGISNLLLACLIVNISSSTWVIIGAMLISISGIGAIMGGAFDVKHKLHGLAFALGIPTLPIGALLVTFHIIKNGQWSEMKNILLFSAHSIWISLLLMAITMMLLFSGFKKAGVAFGPNIDPPKYLPENVIGINGYANRLLIFCYICWPVLFANAYLSI